MSIQRITSGNRTPAERYAQLFAQLYGLEGGGFAQVSATRDQDVPLRTVFEIERNRDRVLSRNARLADATILLRRSIRTTANDRRIRDSLPARTVLLELALKQPDWKERAQAFFKAHPNLQTLHLSGHFPLYRQDDAPNVGAFVDSVLATPFELAHPGDPDQTVLPDSLPAQTLGQLCERFPTQFRTMSAVHFTIPSGWLAIFADRIVVIEAGRVIAEGTADELKKRIGEPICVAVPTDPAKVVEAGAILAELDAVVASDGESVRVPGHHGLDTVTDVAARLRSASIEIADIGLRRPTLDEVFLALTGDEAVQAS